MMPEFVSLGLLGDSTALSLGLWSLSGPAAASAGSPGVVARDTVPMALNFPRLSGLEPSRSTPCKTFTSGEKGQGEGCAGRAGKTGDTK